MLNKKELHTAAKEIAKILAHLEGKSKRGKTQESNLAKEVTAAKNVRIFIEKLTQVVEKMPENAESLRKVVEEVLQMRVDNFPLFITLIRFEYACLKHKK